MKIKTDKSHKRIVSKRKLIPRKVTNIAKTLIIGVIIVGSLLLFTGCGKEYFTYDDYVERNWTQLAEGNSFVQMGMMPITNDIIYQFTPNVRHLDMADNNYISDLSKLPIYAPNITHLSIDNSPLITDYSFVYNLPNLVEFNASNNQGITQELLDYLNANNIKTDLTVQDIQNNNRINEIIDNIITPEMTENDMLKAIVLYVAQNINYDKKLTEESNTRPLDMALQGEGVCASYAYLTTVLGHRAGLTIYTVTGGNHGWNLVELDGKFSYVDPTNLLQLPAATWLLENFDLATFFKQNPYDVSFSAMQSPDKLQKLPEQLLELINEAQDEKTFIEKYGTNVYKNIIIISGLLIGIGCFSQVAKRLGDGGGKRRR